MLQAQIILNKDEMDEHGHPMYLTILQWMVNHNINSAFVVEGAGGIGDHRIIRPGVLFSFDEPPVMILFNDTDEVVRHTLQEIRQFSPSAQMVAYSIESY